MSFLVTNLTDEVEIYHVYNEETEKELWIIIWDGDVYFLVGYFEKEEASK